jgi:predicted transposase YbfD/YdcC
LLAIKGCLVTIDAMGCQTQIAAQIVEQGGDSLLALKNNPKKTSMTITQHLHHYSEHNLPWRTADNFFDAFDNAHGRSVRRRGWIMTDLVTLPVLEQWPGLHMVMAVETMRMAHQQAPVTSDDRFSLASLRRSADTFVRMIRHHWDIEHTWHWSLDVTLNEDHCRIRKDHAPANMAAVRHIALNLLRQEHTHQMRLRQQRLLCGLDEHSLLTVLCRATEDAITPSASPVRMVRSPWECSIDKRVLSKTALLQLSYSHRPAEFLVTTHR